MIFNDLRSTGIRYGGDTGVPPEYVYLSILNETDRMGADFEFLAWCVPVHRRVTGGGIYHGNAGFGATRVWVLGGVAMEWGRLQPPYASSNVAQR